jgi:hypothetical protein
LIGRISVESTGVVEISSPSERNIKSLLAPNGTLRYDSNTFRPLKAFDQILASARKKRKTNDNTDIESKWRAAVDKMMEEHEIDNDGLPSVGLAFSDGLYGSVRQAINLTSTNGKFPRKIANKGKGKRVSSSDSDTSDRWSPPPPDPILVIPGELVFAREPKGTIYWPAKLEAYIPPTKATQKPKYKVVYLDDTRCNITRDLFFTSDQEGFTDCKV